MLCLTSSELRRIHMELWSEVSLTVYGAVMLTCTNLIPFDAEPESVASFRIIAKLTQETNRAQLTTKFNSLTD